MSVIDIEEFRSAGVLPTGSVSAWPKSRHDALMAQVIPSQSQQEAPQANYTRHDTKVKAGLGRMAKGLVGSAAQTIMHGKVSKEVRAERYETCKACPHFIEDSKRCSECGCFMEAKTWINGDPDMLCPAQKWKR